MKDLSALPIADIDALRVGMFVHLELGWMAHPFPVSAFRLASQTQIDTLRGLGLQRVRWSPQHSDDSAAKAAEQGATDRAATMPAAAAAGAAEPVVAQAPQRDLRSAAAQQRAALRKCERQFAEAARELRGIAERVPGEPELAGAQARAFTGALVDKMLSAREANIRLLSEAAGDRASTHGLNVALIALLMGRNFGLTADELIDLGIGASLHDIGKIDLPERLRHRDPSFASAELSRWREHVAHGVEHGRRMGLPGGALTVIAQHHEQADGSGFPRGLDIDRMSAAARIVALVDRYDSLCNPHIAGHALTPHDALSMMFAKDQHQFDTTMLSAFIRMMGVYPPGSVVQLTDDRYALVTTVNSTRPLKPVVLLHDPAAPADDPPVLDLQTAPGLGIRRSLKPQALPRAALAQLVPRPRVLYGFEPLHEKSEAHT